MLQTRLAVWWARLGRSVRIELNQENVVPDFDLNVLPPVLPSRPPPGVEATVTRRVWRKIVYWARSHDRLKHGTINRLSSLNGGSSQEQVCVLGGGAFGTAMAAHVARKGIRVKMIIRNKRVRDFINKRHINPQHHVEYDLPKNLVATTDVEEGLRGCSIFIHAVPVQGSRDALSAIAHALPEGVPIIAISKGVELKTGKLMVDLIPEALGRHQKKNPVVVVSGPSFAREIMDRRPTSVVAASKDQAAADQVQKVLTSHYLRVSTSDDVIGVEVAGALKNVLAIAAGICEGLGLGINAMAALVTQGNAEIRWLATSMGAKPETLSGLSGMGDIILTCFGDLSRNRTVGVRLGKGEPLHKVVDRSKGVAEGVYTSQLVVELADKYRVIMPVLTTVARIINGEVEPRQAVFEVMSLPPLEESA